MWILLVILVLGAFIVKVVTSESPETSPQTVAVWVAGGIVLSIALAMWAVA